MQTYFLASHNLDNGNAVVGPQLYVPSVNQASPLNSNFIALMQEALVSLDTIHNSIGAQSASTSIVILGSTPGVVLLSSDKSAFSVFEDNPDFVTIYNFHVPSESEESDDDLKIPPPLSILKRTII